MTKYHLIINGIEMPIEINNAEDICQLRKDLGEEIIVMNKHKKIILAKDGVEA